MAGTIIYFSIGFAVTIVILLFAVYGHSKDNPNFYANSKNYVLTFFDYYGFPAVIVFALILVLWPLAFAIFGVLALIISIGLLFTKKMKGAKPHENP